MSDKLGPAKQLILHEGHIHDTNGYCAKHFSVYDTAQKKTPHSFCTKCFGPHCPKCPKPSHKVATVEAFFPEAKGNAMRAARGEGGDWPLAAYRALREISKSKGIKGKRLTTVQLTISIGTVIEE